MVSGAGVSAYVKVRPRLIVVIERRIHPRAAMRSASPGSRREITHSWLPLRLLGPFLFLIAAAGPACAQDDGARLYMMAPDKTTIASLRFHRLHSNLAVDPGSVAGDA